jgi:hypothetical protein
MTRLNTQNNKSPNNFPTSLKIWIEYLYLIHMLSYLYWWNNAAKQSAYTQKTWMGCCNLLFSHLAPKFHHAKKRHAQTFHSLMHPFIYFATDINASYLSLTELKSTGSSTDLHPQKRSFNIVPINLNYCCRIQWLHHQLGKSVSKLLKSDSYAWKINQNNFQLYLL